MLVAKGVIYILMAFPPAFVGRTTVVIERFTVESSCQDLADKLSAFNSNTEFKCLSAENLVIVGDQHAGK